MTFFKPRGLFKRAIGTHLGDDGKPRTAIFWLGRDSRRAVQLARMILRAQARFSDKGEMGKHWTAETLARVKQAVKNDDAMYASKVHAARKTVEEADALEAAYLAAMNVIHRLLPAIKMLHAAIAAKAEEWKNIVKIGRTHMQDATPLMLGQEWSGYAGMSKLAGLRSRTGPRSTTTATSTSKHRHTIHVRVPHFNCDQQSVRGGDVHS